MELIRTCFPDFLGFCINEIELSVELGESEKKVSLRVFKTSGIDKVWSGLEDGSVNGGGFKSLLLK